MRHALAFSMLLLVLGRICSLATAQDRSFVSSSSTRSIAISSSSAASAGSSGGAATLDPAWNAEPSSHAQNRWRFSPFAGFDLGVPIMLDVDHELIRPGVNLHAQGGVDFGYVGAFLHAGWRWIPVDFDRAEEAGRESYGGTGRDPLRNPYFGFGLRVRAPNGSRVTPYASAAFDFNFWNFHESGVACGGYYYWWCNTYQVYRFTPGFSGRLGTAIAIGRSVAIDLGVGLSMSFEGDFFERNEAWVEPYLGLTHRM